MRKRLILLTSLVVLSVVGGFGIRFYLDARIPRAIVTLQVHPMLDHPRPWNKPGLMYPGYLSSEFEMPLNDEVLSIAAQSLEGSGASSGDVFPMLKRKVDIENVRGTDFLKIIAKHPSRSQAVLIANTVADTIVTRETNIRKLTDEAALKALDEEVELQVALVAEKQRDLEILCEQFGVEMAILDKASQPDGTSKVGTPGERKWIENLRRSHDSTETNRNLAMVDLLRLYDDYQQSGDLLHEMKIKQQEERVLLKIPRTRVTIHERAK